ncbi:MAG: nitrilase-related carbon-nitrogen hydrolase, partial [Bradymonadia bacterium]
MRIAAVQLCVGDDPDANLDQIRPLVAAAAADGARVVALPENALYMGPTAGKLALAGPLTAENRHFAAFSALAARHGCWLLVGGFPEASSDAARPYNTAFLLDPTGALATHYRKLHLFDVDLPGGPRLCESEHTRAGDTAVVAQVESTLVGLTICYDLRFPELFRALVVDAGARIVFVLEGECHDPEAFDKAAAGASVAIAEDLRELGINGLTVDPKPHRDLARLYFLPNCFAKGVQRRADVYILRSDPYTLT